MQSLDDCVEEIEDRLFDDIPHNMEVQRRSFQLRKSLVLLRRVVLPMREVVNAVMRRDLHVVGDDLVPYYQDVYDHVLRAAEWNDSLRDLVTSILETNVTIQGNRLNIITKKVTGWAAIIAVPTLITGYFGMNVPYPGFSDKAGFTASLAARSWLPWCSTSSSSARTGCRLRPGLTRVSPRSRAGVCPGCVWPRCG